MIFNLYLTFSLTIINSLALFFVVYRYLHILQLYNYKNKEFAYNFFKQGQYKLVLNYIFVVLLFLSVGHTLNYFFVSNDISSYWLFIIFTCYLIFALATFLMYIMKKYKKPLKFTNRVKRIIFCYVLITLILSFIVVYFVNNIVLAFDILYFSSVFGVLILLLANTILMPLEKYFKLKYINKAKNKLNDYKDLIKIGITGSFGKTSTKNFLHTILSQKYSVCTTPLNYNTPLGITKTILNDLDIGHQVFIAEMGARYKNDIKELCQIVEPNYAIITSVGEQHLETFKSLDNIKKEKYKLAEYTSNIVIFNGEDQICFDFYTKSNKGKMIVGFNKKFDVWADDIQTNINGTSFCLHIKKYFISCKTKMLGLLNVQNILSASAMAYCLGLTIEEISKGIEKLQPVKHRMELLNVNDNLTLIDNSYNGNLQGSRESLHILGLMDGIKIVVTPGIVELGKEQSKLNFEFAKNIARIADKVIIVNEINKKSIYEGLISENFKTNNIFCIAKLDEVYEILNKFTKQKCCVLFYNDLPDNYK